MVGVRFQIRQIILDSFEFCVIIVRLDNPRVNKRLFSDIELKNEIRKTVDDTQQSVSSLTIMMNFNRQMIILIKIYFNLLKVTFK